MNVFIISCKITSDFEISANGKCFNFTAEEVLNKGANRYKFIMFPNAKPELKISGHRALVSGIIKTNEYKGNINNQLVCTKIEFLDQYRTAKLDNVSAFNKNNYSSSDQEYQREEEANQNDEDDESHRDLPF